MTEALIEAGTMTANLDERTVTGLLLPYNEVGRSNLGRFAIDVDAIDIPRDPIVVTFTDAHDRTTPLGRADVLTSTPAGIVATFRIADTDEGDAYLVDVAAGKRNKLSAEVSDIVLRAGRAIAGRLFGGAAVDAGAFPSAALMAADVGDVLDAALSDEDQAAVADLATQIVAIAAPQEDPTKEGTNMSDATLEAARVPSTLNAQPSKTVRPRTTLVEVAHALALFNSANDRSALDALAEKDGSALFATLSDITTAGVGGPIMQPQWVSDVWAARTFARKIVPLLSSGPLTSLKIQGFRFTTPPAGGAWTGDKTAVPSNTPVTEEVNETATRWAGGHDIAREYLDFSVAEFWTSYYAYMANDYAKFSDDETVDQLADNATTVVSGAVPAGINPAVVQLVDGAIAVLNADGTPTFAVAAPDVYRSLLLANADNLLATLALSTGLEQSQFAGFGVVSHARIPAGHVLVGDRAAATFRELPGSPIRTTSLDQVRGGVDEVAFGYFNTLINNVAAIVDVGPAVAGRGSTKS